MSLSNISTFFLYGYVFPLFSFSMYMYCCFVTHAVRESCRSIVGAIVLGNRSGSPFISAGDKSWFYPPNVYMMISSSVCKSCRQCIASLGSLSFIYSVLIFLYIATLLITRSGDVVLYPGPSMNPNSVNSSFDSYTTLTNSGLSIMNLKPETETRHSNSKNPTMRCSCLY